ncbi:MAG: hypothetical protein ACJAQX_001800 [Polaribacter sp.]|jgi:uncharacterized protein YneF (UPF0154 family)
MEKTIQILIYIHAIFGGFIIGYWMRKLNKKTIVSKVHD